MKKQYKIQLPKGKKVTMTNVDFEDGVMTVNVELENRENFHEAIHNEVCGVFGKINNQWKEVLKANGITREKIEEMAKESIKELEKDCPFRNTEKLYVKRKSRSTSRKTGTLCIYQQDMSILLSSKKK